MYLKAISLPISYLQLAKANSVGYLITEAIADVVTVVLVIVLYYNWGLWGTGLAVTLSYLADIIIVYLYTHIKYGYSISLPVVQLATIQIPLGLVVYATTLLDSPVFRWTLGVALCFVSAVVSLTILHQKVGLWNALKNKLNKKLHRDG
jgi:hypothetical protein